MKQRKVISPNFPFYIYFQADEETVTIRFLWHGRQDREFHISDKI